SMVGRHHAAVPRPDRGAGTLGGVDSAAPHQPGAVLRRAGAARAVAGVGCPSAGSEWSEAPAGPRAFADAGQDVVARPRRHGYRWADLMRRTFGVDVLECPRCGGRLRLMALIEHARVVEPILRHLGRPTGRP